MPVQHSRGKYSDYPEALKEAERDLSLRLWHVPPVRSRLAAAKISAAQAHPLQYHHLQVGALALEITGFKCKQSSEVQGGF